MLEWTEQAAQQLDQTHDYIALSNSADVAARVVQRILASIERLTSFPMSGRAGRVAGTRELVIPNTPMVAAYAVDRSRVVILAIYHGSQKWPDAF